jgi:MraZ protein
MTQFVGTHQNLLDGKGRVSIPAPFRARLKTGDGSVGLVLRPSHKRACIEGWSVSAFEALAAPLQRLDLFSEEQDDLAVALYADSFPIEADKDGRVVLPERLRTHAGLLQGLVTFIGLGRTFEIWDPVAAERHVAEVRARLAARRPTLPGGVA